MPETHITMDAKMGKRDADLMLSWLQHAMSDLISQGVLVSLERGRNDTTITLTCEDEDLLATATDAFAQLAMSSAHES